AAGVVNLKGHQTWRQAIALANCQLAGPGDREERAIAEHIAPNQVLARLDRVTRVPLWAVLGGIERRDVKGEGVVEDADHPAQRGNRPAGFAPLFAPG